MKKVCEEYGAIEVREQNGVIDFEDYLKLFYLVVMCQIRYCHKIDMANKEARLAALEANDTVRFNQITSQMVRIQDSAKNAVCLNILDYYNVTHELYYNSAAAADQRRDLAIKISQTADKAENDERLSFKGEDYQVLERDALLQHIDAIEQRKAKQMAGVYIAVNSGQIPQEALPIAEKVVKIETHDLYEKDVGVDYNDIMLSIFRHDILATQEFNSIIQRGR